MKPLGPCGVSDGPVSKICVGSKLPGVFGRYGKVYIQPHIVGAARLDAVSHVIDLAY